MTPEISEFSYGFVLTNQLVGWAELHVAPIFPSLVEEGKLGGGYDVKLDLPAVPLYLQFKRSHCMTRRSAREINTHGLDLQVPFHRFEITERHRSFQHTSLLELDDGVNLVFYVAPRFHTLDEINSAWSEKTVAQRSIFVRPSEIGLIEDDESHAVSFDPFRTFFCSEPREIRSFSVEKLREKLLGEFQGNPAPLRSRLPDWQRRAREARSRANETQARLELHWEELRLQRLGEKLPQSGSDYSGEVRSERRGLASEGLETPAAIGRLPPPLPSMAVRGPRPRTEEEAALQDLSDEARRNFNAQLFIAQPAGD